MPLEWLVDYWSHAGKYVLPYFANRKIAIEEKFDDQTIFRRHDKNKNWIYVKNQTELDQYVRQHAFSFHPHQLSDDNIFWLLLDIDNRNPQLPFSYIIEVTKIMAGILQKNHQPYLLKFSGNRGFHFMWSLGKIKKTDLKDDEFFIHTKQIIQNYADELTVNIENSPIKSKLIKYFAKNQPIINTNFADKELSNSILLDKNIIRPNAVFRSPWSIHPKTNLVSAPLKLTDLDNFDRQNYTVDKTIPQLHHEEIPTIKFQAL